MEKIRIRIRNTGFYQRNILRDMRPGATSCLACWAMRTNKLKQCTVRGKICCTGLTRAAKAGQKSLVPARRAQRTNQERNPFLCTLLLPQFQHSARTTPLQSPCFLHTAPSTPSPNQNAQDDYLPLLKDKERRTIYKTKERVRDERELELENKQLTLVPHYQSSGENSKQQFPEKELPGHSPNFHIHVFVSDLYIPTIDLLILLQEKCGPVLGIYSINSSQTHECGNCD